MAHGYLFPICSLTLSRWTLKRLDLAYAAFFDRLKARNGRTGFLTWEHALPVSLSPPLREDRSIGAHVRIKLARYWAGSTIATIESRPTVSPAWQRIAATVPSISLAILSSHDDQQRRPLIGSPLATLTFSTMPVTGARSSLLVRSDALT
jgi:hypothetical protein